MDIDRCQKIEITDFDAMRLKILLITAGNSASINAKRLNKLDLLLKYAELIPSERIKPDRVTMNSKIRLRDVCRYEEMILTLVFPATALVNRKSGTKDFKVSVLSPLGLSLLGRKADDVIAGRINIAEVLYQPEAEGNYDL